MISLQTLYDQAGQENIVIDRCPLKKREAFSLMDEDGDCFIAIDPERISGESDERSKLSHELGHCVTGSFYNQWAACDIRRKHENRADKWAVTRLVSLEELDDAVANGLTELWELAEFFGITEDMMKKAVCWYTYGNMAAELYF